MSGHSWAARSGVSGPHLSPNPQHPMYDKVLVPDMQISLGLELRVSNHFHKFPHGKQTSHSTVLSSRGIMALQGPLGST